MANCEEAACNNGQAGICLHCLRRLCQTHLLADEDMLLNHSEDLHEQIGEVTHQLNLSLRQIRSNREKAAQQLRDWRQKHIDQIERTYTDQLQDSKATTHELTKLENRLTQPLLEEAQEPLDQLQTQTSINDDQVQLIRQVIEAVTQESRQFASISQKPANRASSKGSTSARINSAKQHSASKQRFPNSTAVVVNSSTEQPRKKLINLFRNISEENDTALKKYITQNFLRLNDSKNMLLTLLSLFTAWHSVKTPTKFNRPILSHHIPYLKTFMQRRDQELLVLQAIAQFVTACNYQDGDSSQMLIELIEAFLTHGCLSTATILDWYQNGAAYRCDNFPEVQLWAEPFVDQLNANAKLETALESS